MLTATVMIMCDGDGANDHDGHIVVDGDEHEDEDIDDDAGGDRSGGSNGVGGDGDGIWARFQIFPQARGLKL